MPSPLRTLRKTMKSLVSHVWFTRSIRLNGRKFRVPMMMGHGSGNLGEHEPDVERLIARMLAASSGTFIDVGTNIGQLLMKVKAYDPGRDYVGFEASTFCSFYVTPLLSGSLKLGGLEVADL